MKNQATEMLQDAALKYIHMWVYTYIYILYIYISLSVPWCSDGQESACNAGDLSSIPGWERSPQEGNGNPLPYSCLENPTD